MKSEFSKFDETMRKLIAVPHSEIKAKLDAEKRAKAQKRRLGGAAKAKRTPLGR